MAPVKTSEPFVAPVGQPVKLNLPPALGLALKPFGFAAGALATKLPKVNPATTGTGVGSVLPVPGAVLLTLAKV